MSSQNTSSFIVNNFEPLKEPTTIGELAEMSKEELSPKNLMTMVNKLKERVKKNPKFLTSMADEDEEEDENEVNREQLTYLCTLLGSKMSERDVDEILREVDFDGNGEISNSEFFKALEHFI